MSVQVVPFGMGICLVKGDARRLGHRTRGCARV
jgi:hypothetical protein